MAGTAMDWKPWIDWGTKFLGFGTAFWAYLIAQRRALSDPGIRSALQRPLGVEWPDLIAMSAWIAGALLLDRYDWSIVLIALSWMISCLQFITDAKPLTRSATAAFVAITAASIMLSSFWLSMRIIESVHRLTDIVGRMVGVK